MLGRATWQLPVISPRRGLALAGIIISAASIMLSIVYAIVILAVAANAPSYSNY